MTLKEAEKLLADAGIEDARHEARIIFAAIGGEPIYKLLTPNYANETEEVKNAVLRRAAREPLAYIIGCVDFYNERYKVTPDCLIPRPDTEILVDYAVNEIPEGETFIDLCTGSGCVAISTLANTENTRAIAVDISEGALSVAKENAGFMEVADRIEFLRADVTERALCDKVFAVLSNPPYVSESAYKTLEPEIFKEPAIAFLGGEDGGDSKFRDAVKLAIEEGKISTSLMQRRLGVGYGRAAKIIDSMEELGYVSKPDGNKPRRVLITMQEYMDRTANGTLGGSEE
jgi:release factor glutamine methyltransferase